MQKTSTVCDACGVDDVPPGFVVVNFGGDRAAIVKGRLPGGRPTLELCDACAESLADWAIGRATPAPVAAAAEAVPAEPPSVEEVAHDLIS